MSTRSDLRGISRRAFLRNAGLAGGGLVVGVSLVGCSGSPRPAIIGAENDFVPNAFLQITPDNEIHFHCPRDEMGQGIQTGLASVLGEDLDVAPQTFRIHLAPAHPDYNHPLYGFQQTGGSTSMSAHYQALRQMGADVRALILEAASQDLAVPVSSLDTDDGYVISGDTRLPYGQFVATAQTLPMPEGTPLRDGSAFRWIGADFPRLDGVAKATGTEVYGIDFEIEGMHRAVIRHAPVHGGTVRSVDDSAARAMPGVTDVVTLPSAVAVVAERHWQARNALDALDVQWALPDLAAVSSADMRAAYEAAIESGEGPRAAETGDVDAALAQANAVFERDYFAPFLAHAPLEPMNATARVRGDEVEIWTGTQAAQFTQGAVANALGIANEQVIVHPLAMGGGFGRRQWMSHAAEAAWIARETGKTVQLLWSRENDMRDGWFRPASAVRVRAIVTEDGRIDTWHVKRAGPNSMPDVMETMLPGLDLPRWLERSIVGTAEWAMDGMVADPTVADGLAADYDIANQAVELVNVDHGVPLAFWRAVSQSYTPFVKESAIDEIASEIGMDAIDLRLRNLSDAPRLRAVIERARARMNEIELPDGHAWGFAAGSSFGSHIAQAAEVSVEGSEIRVHRFIGVLDCGLAVNPDSVRAQMESGVMYGLTAALYGKVEFDQGSVVQSNFHDYPILRMDAAPAVETILMDSDAPPTGVGETTLANVAPAVANGVFAATGRRLRDLPLQIG